MKGKSEELKMVEEIFDKYKAMKALLILKEISVNNDNYTPSKPTSTLLNSPDLKHITIDYAQEYCILIEAIIDKLSKRDKIIALDSFVRGTSNNDIADRLGIALRTVGRAKNKFVDKFVSELTATGMVETK